MKRLLVLVSALLATATPALAHVEVSPDTAPKGGSGTFTFNVEDERDSANEVKVEIFFPDGVVADHVTPSAPAGWTWTFESDPAGVAFVHAAPGPQGDQSFTLAIGGLPSAEEMVFKAVVTYDNGDVDRWIDLPSGAKEPPHPAAVVKLTGGATTATTTAARNTLTTLKHPDKTNAGGIAAVIIAALVVVGSLAAFALRGRRRTP